MWHSHRYSHSTTDSTSNISTANHIANLPCMPLYDTIRPQHLCPNPSLGLFSTRASPSLKWPAQYYILRCGHIDTVSKEMMQLTTWQRDVSGSLKEWSNPCRWFPYYGDGRRPITDPPALSDTYCSVWPLRPSTRQKTHTGCKLGFHNLLLSFLFCWLLLHTSGCLAAVCPPFHPRHRQSPSVQHSAAAAFGHLQMDFVM